MLQSFLQIAEHFIGHGHVAVDDAFTSFIIQLTGYGQALGRGGEGRGGEGRGGEGRGGEGRGGEIKDVEGEN